MDGMGWMWELAVGRTVARVRTKAALFAQTAMSWSCIIIFLTLDTVFVRI